MWFFFSVIYLSSSSIAICYLFFVRVCVFVHINIRYECIHFHWEIKNNMHTNTYTDRRIIIRFTFFRSQNWTNYDIVISNCIIIKFTNVTSIPYLFFSFFLSRENIFNRLYVYEFHDKFLKFEKLFNICRLDKVLFCNHSSVSIHAQTHKESFHFDGIESEQKLFISVAMHICISLWFYNAVLHCTL